MTVGLLRELFRHLQAFRALHEAEGITVLRYGAEEYALQDIEYLYEQTKVLPFRQRQAIQLCLIENRREVDAAVIMGVSRTNPVASYASAGIKKLLELVATDSLARFRPDSELVA